MFLGTGAVAGGMTCGRRAVEAIMMQLGRRGCFPAHTSMSYQRRSTIPEARPPFASANLGIGPSAAFRKPHHSWLVLYYRAQR